MYALLPVQSPHGARRVRELLAATAVAILLTAVFTWPMVARFDRTGRIDSGDGRFSIWNIAWVAHALTTDPRELWNANIFYPHTGALAFSEANLVAGVIATPMWLATHNPYATSNWTIAWSFVLAAIAMFALVRHLTNNLWGAALSGVVFAFCSYSFSHLAHIQLLMTFGLPLALLRMHMFVEAPSPKTAAWLGLALAVQALACGYYGVFGGLAVAIGLLWFAFWSGQFRSFRFWLTAALAAAIAVALVSPFLLPYLKIQQAGFARSLDDARMFRAGWRSYLASALLVYQWILPLIGQWREVLFPGLLSISLAGVAIFRAVRQPEVLRLICARRLVGFYVLLAVVAAWASFGPDAGLYGLLYRVVPFMGMLRAPARLGLLVTLAAAVLAGIGVSSMERAWVGPRRRVWLTALVVITLARSSVGPLNWQEVSREPRAVTWLGQVPRGAVAEFPFFRRPDLDRETTYMLQSTWHWQPMLNGYSDFVPDAVSADVQLLETFPAEAALRVLRERQARYVMVNWMLYSEPERTHLRDAISALPATLHPLLNDNEASLFEFSTPIAKIR